MSPKKKLLQYLGSKALPIATFRDIWPKFSVVQEDFWKIADEERAEAHPLFEYVSSESWGENVPLGNHT